jgi:hypothetical protein
MTLTRRALLTRALSASAVSVTARAATVAAPAAASRAPAAAGKAPAWIEADLPAAQRLLGLSYTPAQRRQLARTYPPVLEPRAICLWSALFREDLLITMGRALEAVLGVADQNPPLSLS